MSNSSLIRKVLFVLGPIAIVIALVVGMASTASTAEAGKQLANGASCTFSSDCASGKCTFKKCVAKSGSSKQLGNGMDCTFGSDCESGKCTFKKCVSRSGGKKLGNGVACTFGSDCESGKCTFKKCVAR